MVPVAPKARRPWLLLAFLLPLLLAQPLWAGEKAAIRELVVTNSERELLLYLTVANAFTPELEAGIHNGLPATFTYSVRLKQLKKGWADKEVASFSFDRTLTYDNLKKEYQVLLGEREGKAEAAASLAAAERMMSEVNGLAVLPVDKLAAEASYRLQVKAILAKNTLPLSLHYLIPFWGLWDFKTDWATVEFTY